jgi:site-specific DNA-cytosine methylase
MRPAKVSAGFEVRLALDLDEHALSVYRANHTHPAVLLDLGDVPLAVETIRSVGKVDVLAGSPPCQDYSCSGSTWWKKDSSRR